MKRIAVLMVLFAAGNLLAQARQQVLDTKGAAPLEAQREKLALQSLLKIAERMLISAVDVHARRQVRVCAD